MAFSVHKCGIELHSPACDHIGTLNTQKLLCLICKTLLYCCDIIGDAVGKALLFKPCTCKNVTLHKEQKRCKACCFKAGAVKHRKIKAGTLFLTEKHIGSFYSDVSALKAHGRIYKAYLSCLYCFKNGCCLLLYVIVILHLIAEKLRTARPLLQKMRGTLQKCGHTLSP